MNSQSDDKEKLSRRGFTKSVAALAAVPLASSLADAQSKPATQGAQPTTQRPPQVAPRVITRGRNEHDTPPPVEIINGSFIVETENDFAAGDIVSMGNITRHNIKPATAGNNRIFPAHIKVIDGSGELLFRLDTNTRDNPHPAESFRIALLLRDGTTVVLASSPVASNMQTFAIDTNNDRSLAPPTAGDVPVGDKRGARRRIRRNNGMPTTDTSINELTITNVRTGKVLYGVLPSSELASEGHELRIMIWLEENRVP